jgi:hypothetical protein
MTDLAADMAADFALVLPLFGHESRRPAPLSRRMAGFFPAFGQ